MNKRPSPCKDCQERHPCCHSECVRYKEMVDKNNEIKAAKKEAYEQNRLINMPYERKRKKKRYPQ